MYNACVDSVTTKANSVVRILGHTTSWTLYVVVVFFKFYFVFSQLPSLLLLLLLVHCLSMNELSFYTKQPQQGHIFTCVYNLLFANMFGRLAFMFNGCFPAFGSFMRVSYFKPIWLWIIYAMGIERFSQNPSKIFIYEHWNDVTNDFASQWL